MKDKDHPTGLDFREGMLWVTLKDRRVIGTPLAAFPWLEKAEAEQQQHFELYPLSIYWPDLDDGIDIHALITGEWTTPVVK
jgi:hypothetical protein